MSRGVEVDWAYIRQEIPGQGAVTRGFVNSSCGSGSARRKPSVMGSSPIRPTTKHRLTRVFCRHKRGETRIVFSMVTGSIPSALPRNLVRPGVLDLNGSARLDESNTYPAADGLRDSPIGRSASGFNSSGLASDTFGFWTLNVSPGSASNPCTQHASLPTMSVSPKTRRAIHAEAWCVSPVVGWDARSSGPPQDAMIGG